MLRRRRARSFLLSWIGVLALAGACGVPAGSAPPIPIRPTAPPDRDPAARGPAIDLALEIYPALARAANAVDAGEWSQQRDVRDGYARARQRCDDSLRSLQSGIPGESDDDRRRRHLVLGGCQFLLDVTAESARIDHVLSLLQLALKPPDAGAPSLRRPER